MISRSELRLKDEMIYVFVSRFQDLGLREVRRWSWGLIVQEIGGDVCGDVGEGSSIR